jgi:hypothetical protein
MTYTSEAVGRMLRYLTVMRGARGERYLVRSFAARHPDDLALAAREVLHPRSIAVAYPPASLLLVGGSAQDIAMVTRLVEAWDAPLPAQKRRGGSAGRPGLTGPSRR